MWTRRSARGPCGGLGTGLAGMVTTTTCDPTLVSKCAAGAGAGAVIVTPANLLPRGGESDVPAGLGGLASCGAGTLCGRVARSEGVGLGTKGLAGGTPNQYVFLDLIPMGRGGICP